MAFAFATILAVLVVTGVVLRHEAERVHGQTHEIMENAVPSVVAATRLKDLVLGFPTSSTLSDSDDERQYSAAVARFRDVLTHQQQAATFFPGERQQLDVVEGAFQRYLTLERETRGEPPAARRKVDRARERLAAACERFGTINEQGMSGAQAILAEVAAREERVLLIGLGVAVVTALIWAVLLAGAIARPLAILAQEVGGMPFRGPIVASRLGRLVPREFLAVGHELERTAAILREAAEAREVVARQLEASLAREVALNGDLASTNAALDREVARQTANLAEANRTLTRLVAELQEMAQSKASFYAAVSHELRTPVAVIKGGALTLAGLGGRLEREAAERLLANIVSEADDLARLVEDLLDAARMDAGSFGITPEPEVDAGALVKGVLGSVAPLFEEQELRLELAIIEPLPLIEADPVRLRQALRNVLENAAKFSPAGRTVRVWAAAAEEAAQPCVVIEVADEGPGIPPALQPRLFQPFVQGEHAQGGTGLGLAITRQLLELHGGGIEVAANEAGGSTFRLWVPALAPGRVST
ncbi:MAG: HAMP domain-containing sensor histidine kinase [Candidatus Sericytochromatia bacterium]|nr:HAMP domain-containing sensor histidine kinase [Candidatus Sericytochromatia bacterium]